MANMMYNAGKLNLAKGAVAWLTDTIKIMLVTSSYTPNIDTHTVKSDVTNEVTGTGYTAGGVALGNKTATQDNTNDRAVLDADDSSWATATITAAGAVIYKDTGTAGTSPILCYIDFGGNVTSTAGTFTVTYSANGVMYQG